MDKETRTLRAVLRERDRLRASLAATEKPLHAALDAWHASRPGNLRGKATEQGARFVLGQAGLL